MPRSKAHKQQTRERIVRTAARAFRAAGVNGIGVAELMQQAGLTHGGFYAHFRSKDALVAEACAQGLAESSEQLFAAADEAPPGEGLRAIIHGYLSRSHRDRSDTGCMLAALAPDIAREPPEVRHSFTQALQRYVGRLARYLPERPARAIAPPNAPEEFGEEVDNEEREERALLLLSSLVGAMALARAVDDPALSDQLLVAARRFSLQTFGEGVGTDATEETEEGEETYGAGAPATPEVDHQPPGRADARKRQ
jgi:TetR/AcrR family transcriptional repressor of nem operon